MPFFGSVERTFNFGSPQLPIVTSGLQVYLDAGNTSSYPGSGITWTDLTGNARNATLVNTPTYSSSQSGYLSFLDTSFQCATIPNIGNLSQWTIEAWTRITASLNGKVTAVVCNQFDGINKLNFSLGTNRAPTSYNLCTGFYDGTWRTTNGFTPTQNTWIQLIGTYNGTTLNQYVNSVLDTTLSYAGTPQSGGEIRIARRWDSPNNDSTNFYRGDISIVRIYNRALSTTEIAQNWNANRGRYGL